MDATRRIYTTYEAANYVQQQTEKVVDDADIRRACGVGAIPFAELHDLSASKTVWMIPRVGLDAWIAAGLPGRHTYQYKAIKAAGGIERPSGQGQCLLCGGPMFDGFVTQWFPVSYDETSKELRHVLVRGMPVLKCIQCGYTYHRGEVADRVKQIVNEGKAVPEQHLAVTFDPGPDPELQQYVAQCQEGERRVAAVAEGRELVDKALELLLK